MANLAIKGGSPLYTKGFPAWAMSTGEDRNNLKAAYETGNWGPGGEQNRRFAADFAAYSGVKYCIPVANGTVSIEMILRGLGIGRGDEVIVPPYTFIASVSALIYAGVTPVFADIDKDTFLLSPESAEKAITPRTKAIMPVYVGGRPAELYAFEALCKKHGLYLIGDAAQAVGSEYDGKGVGNYGIAASISCQASKNLTCGEGGIILTNDDALYGRIRQMLNGGMGEDGRYHYVGLSNGMSEFQAAVLNTQLKALPDQIAKRMENAAYLTSLLDKLPFVYTLKKDLRVTRDSYHLFLFGLREEMFRGVSKQTFVDAVNAEGIPLSVGYMPVYTSPSVSGPYAVKCVGGPLNVTPDTPVADLVSYHEGCWLYHATLLGERGDMEAIANALLKVYENIDELI